MQAFVFLLAWIRFSVYWKNIFCSNYTWEESRQERKGGLSWNDGVRKEKQVIYGFPPLLSFQRCPAILLVVSCQLLLRHPKVAIINLHRSHQDPIPAHFLLRDLASYLAEKTAVMKYKFLYLPSSSFHLKLTRFQLLTQTYLLSFRKGQVNISLSFPNVLSFYAPGPIVL